MSEQNDIPDPNINKENTPENPPDNPPENPPENLPDNPPENPQPSHTKKSKHKHHIKISKEAPVELRPITDDNASRTRSRTVLFSKNKSSKGIPVVSTDFPEYLNNNDGHLTGELGEKDEHGAHSKHKKVKKVKKGRSKTAPSGIVSDLPNENNNNDDGNNNSEDIICNFSKADLESLLNNNSFENYATNNFKPRKVSTFSKQMIPISKMISFSKDPAENKKTFYSVKTIADYVRSQQQ